MVTQKVRFFDRLQLNRLLHNHNKPRISTTLSTRNVKYMVLRRCDLVMEVRKVSEFVVPARHREEE